LFCRSLTSVEIPGSMTEIGESAFELCDSLTRIRVSPDNETFATIDNVLIEKKSETLTCYPCGLSDDEYVIPKGIKKIGVKAFSSCSSLIRIEIPDSVTEIEARAFEDCSGLISVEIADSVIEIGEGAFSFCSSLTRIEIPDSVKDIGVEAFRQCSSLTLIAERDSYAAEYAKANGIPYE